MNLEKKSGAYSTEAYYEVALSTVNDVSCLIENREVSVEAWADFMDSWRVLQAFHFTKRKGKAINSNGNYSTLSFLWGDFIREYKEIHLDTRISGRERKSKTQIKQLFFQLVYFGFTQKSMAQGKEIIKTLRPLPFVNLEVEIPMENSSKTSIQKRYGGSRDGINKHVEDLASLFDDTELHNYTKVQLTMFTAKVDSVIKTPVYVKKQILDCLNYLNNTLIEFKSKPFKNKKAWVDYTTQLIDVLRSDIKAPAWAVRRKVYNLEKLISSAGAHGAINRAARALTFMKKMGLIFEALNLGLFGLVEEGKTLRKLEVYFLPNGKNFNTRTGVLQLKKGLTPQMYEEVQENCEVLFFNNLEPRSNVEVAQKYMEDTYTENFDASIKNVDTHSGKEGPFEKSEILLDEIVRFFEKGENGDMLKSGPVVDGKQLQNFYVDFLEIINTTSKTIQEGMYSRNYLTEYFFEEIYKIYRNTSSEENQSRENHLRYEQLLPQNYSVKNQLRRNYSPALPRAVETEVDFEEEITNIKSVNLKRDFKRFYWAGFSNFFEEFEVINLDFSALHANIMSGVLYKNYGTPIKNIDWDQVFNQLPLSLRKQKTISRGVVKRLLLSRLYGKSKNTVFLKGVYNPKENAAAVNKELLRWFKNNPLQESFDLYLNHVEKQESFIGFPLPTVGVFKIKDEKISKEKIKLGNVSQGFLETIESLFLMIVTLELISKHQIYVLSLEYDGLIVLKDKKHGELETPITEKMAERILGTVLKMKEENWTSHKTVK